MIIEQFLLVSSICIISTTGSALHGPCETDDDCGTIDTICHKGICVCTENFTILYDSCVPLAHPKISCRKKHDCHKTLGIRGMCIKKTQCACQPFHHLHHGQCVKNRDLHDTCDHDHQCYCGGDCQDKIACIHKNCSCKAGHRPYKSRRCISEDPVILTVADQQKQIASIEEEPLQVPKEKTSSGSTTSPVPSLIAPIEEEEPLQVPKEKPSSGSTTSPVPSLIVLIIYRILT